MGSVFLLLVGLTLAETPPESYVRPTSCKNKITSCPGLQRESCKSPKLYFATFNPEDPCCPKLEIQKEEKCIVYIVYFRSNNSTLKVSFFLTFDLKYSTTVSVKGSIMIFLSILKMTCRKLMEIVLLLRRIFW